MIELLVMNALEAATGVPGFLEVPEDKPGEFITVERTGGGQRGHQMRDAVLAVRAYSTTMLGAAQRNEEILNIMRELQYEHNDVVSCELNSSYNYTDPESKLYRYQSVFNIVYIV